MVHIPDLGGKFQISGQGKAFENHPHKGEPQEHGGKDAKPDKERAHFSI